MHRSTCSGRSPCVTRREGENVWEYPRPPRLERFCGIVRVVHRGVEVACAEAAQRLLETSHPPTYSLPLSAFTPRGRSALRPSARRATGGEWKGITKGIGTTGCDVDHPNPTAAPIHVQSPRVNPTALLSAAQPMPVLVSQGRIPSDVRRDHAVPID